MNANRVEVRQCPKCASPSVLLVHEWQHTNFAGATGEVTKEYRCQQCGAWEVKRSKYRVLGLWIGGLLALPACGAGIPFIYVAWKDGRFEERVKLLQDAPVPAMRFPGGPPKRVCAGCGGVASAISITRHTHKGIPTGTDYVYACSGCQKEFTTENWLGHVASSFLTLGSLAFMAGFLFGADSPAWKWGGTVVMGLITAVVGWSGLEKLINRFKHKEVGALP